MGATVGWIILLLLSTLVLIFFEILTPSFGIFTALALAAIGGAIWLAFAASTSLGVLVVAVVVVGLPAYVVLLVRLLPKLRISRNLFLGHRPKATAEAAPDAQRYESLVGRTGTAETMLRPVGAIRVDGERIPAQAESGLIDKGETVRVVAATMANVVVRRVTPT